MVSEQELSDLVQAEIAGGNTVIMDIYRKLRDADQYDRNSAAFYRDVAKMGITRPKSFPKKGKGTKRNSIRDKYIALGLSIGEIARRETKKRKLKDELSRQAVSQYIHNTGLYEFWREKRDKVIAKEKEEREKSKSDRVQLLSERKNLVDLLNERFWERACDQGIAYEKAVQYDLMRRVNSANKIPLGKLITLFKTYYEAKEQDIKLSLDELGKASDISPQYVGEILKEVGERAMFKVSPRIVTSPYKKEAIKRSYNLKMNYTDIAYFLGLKRHVVAQNTIKWFGDRRKYPDQIIKFSRSGLTKDRSRYYKLTFPLASQVYEALDAGFTKEEACEYAHVSKRIFNIAVKKRESISEKIVEALKVLYPDKNYQTPFLVPKKMVV